MTHALLSTSNIIIAATCILTWMGIKDASLINKYAFDLHKVLSRREYHRLFTAGFFHADYWQLFFNMLFLFLIGRGAEAMLGPVNYFIIYALGIAGTNTLMLLANQRKNIFYYSLGSSGGVSSLLFAVVLLMPYEYIRMLPIPISMPFWLFGVLYLAGATYAFKKNKLQSGIETHIGGALVGLCTMAIMQPGLLAQNPLLFTALFLMSLSLFMLMAYGKNVFSIFYRIKMNIPKQTPMADRYGEEGTKKFTVDSLLDKIAKTGIGSLTAEEKAFLEKQSKRKR